MGGLREKKVNTTAVAKKVTNAMHAFSVAMLSELKVDA
jgi:hypothetical protein